MGRRPNYELKAVLRTAAALFRARGFHAVSVDDIVQTTGLNRFALYEKFGGKEGLFYDTLDFYHQVMVSQELLGPLYRETASLETVMRRLRVLRRMSLDPALRPGCLIINANIELCGKDERVAAAAEFVMATFREAINHALRRAEWRGELCTSRSVDECSDYAALMLQAFFSLAYLSSAAADRLLGELIEEIAGWRTTAKRAVGSPAVTGSLPSQFQNARSGFRH